MQDSSRNADQAPEMIDMMGGRLEVIARMGTSDTDTALFRTRVAADKLVPLHSHVDPECFYVLSGRIEVFVIDDTPGWRAVEAGAEHACRQRGTACSAHNGPVRRPVPGHQRSPRAILQRGGPTGVTER